MKNIRNIIILIIGNISLNTGLLLLYFIVIRYVDSNPKMNYSIGFDKIYKYNTAFRKPDNKEYLNFSIASIFLILIGISLITLFSMNIYKYKGAVLNLKRGYIVLITWLSCLFLSSLIFIVVLQNEIKEADTSLNSLIDIIQPPYIISPFKKTIDVYCLGNFTLCATYFMYENDENSIQFAYRNRYGKYLYNGLIKNYESNKTTNNNENIEIITFLWHWNKYFYNYNSGTTKVVILKNYTKSIFYINLTGDDMSEEPILGELSKYIDEKTNKINDDNNKGYIYRFRND